MNSRFICASLCARAVEHFLLRVAPCNAYFGSNFSKGQRTVRLFPPELLPRFVRPVLPVVFVVENV
ncbi:hypothetical protein THS5294_01298 [Thalassobacter stenotrophicus]|uniref:Uncharacterized protein n=2 Tax=Thalassobacter stenotrophicus TaxID=266809 RepID=A0A0P1EY60_9RHOB|nr:hypothetical protein THS5294_01298 [Thalassobacter stenotrophicus]SHJ41223.1 hypothetical protein SAMN02744035_03649 [Thalassobacter stenotrophicus DSM 16310]